VEVTLSLERILEVLGEIRNYIAEADKLAMSWEAWLRSDQRVDAVERDSVCRYIERAFVQTIVLLESLNMPGTLSEVRKLNQQAENDYAETHIARDLYLVWAEKLRNYTADAWPAEHTHCDEGNHRHSSRHAIRDHRPIFVAPMSSTSPKTSLLCAVSPANGRSKHRRSTWFNTRIARSVLTFARPFKLVLHIPDLSCVMSS
jgi:hypothetical protein